MKESDPPPTSLDGTNASASALDRLQNFVVGSLRQPLSCDYSISKESAIEEQVLDYVLPGAKMSAVARLEIYCKQYWYRLEDSFEEDFPGILAVLGKVRFNELARKYICQYPSRSFLMRDLGKDLASFVTENEELVQPHSKLIYDLARFEFAQVLAFDEASMPALDSGLLETTTIEGLSLCLQPYITLLSLDWALDDFSVALKKSQTQVREASSLNRKDVAIEAGPQLPLPEKIYLVVHRFDNRVYFKRLDRHSFSLLSAIERVHRIEPAVQSLVGEFPELTEDLPQLSSQVSAWFKVWVRLGFFSQYKK